MKTLHKYIMGGFFMNKKTLLYVGLALFSLISFIVLGKNNIVVADHNANHVTSQSDPIVSINDQMNILYEWSKESNILAAYNQLQTLKHYIKIHNKQLESQYEHWHLFQDELNLLEKQLSIVNSNSWKNTVTRLYLASDAMVQGEKGPWREYEVLLMERIRLMEGAFINPSQYRTPTLQANLALIDEQVERVALAAQLVGNKEKMDELQFRILDTKAFLLTLPNEVEQEQYYQQLNKSVKGIKQSTLALFENTASVSVEPIINQQQFPVQLAALLVFLLAFVLSFTSYRKYKQSPYGVKRL